MIGARHELGTGAMEGEDMAMKPQHHHQRPTNLRRDVPDARQTPLRLVRTVHVQTERQEVGTG